MRGVPTIRADLPFPSDADRQALHQRITTSGFKSLNDLETWRWHAYIYASRRVLLEDLGQRSPVDEQGEWYDPMAIDQAEDFYRRKFRARQTAPSPGLVREGFEDCRLFRTSELSQAELDLCLASLRLEAGQDHISLAEAAARRLGVALSAKRKAFKAPVYDDYKPGEVPLAPAVATAKFTPERLAELEGKLQR